MTFPRYIERSEGMPYWVDRFVRTVEFELALGTHPNLIALEVLKVRSWRVIAQELKTHGYPELAAALAQAAQA